MFKLLAALAHFTGTAASGRPRRCQQLLHPRHVQLVRLDMDQVPVGLGTDPVPARRAKAITKAHAELPVRTLAA